MFRSASGVVELAHEPPAGFLQPHGVEAPISSNVCSAYELLCLVSQQYRWGVFSVRCRFQHPLALRFLTRVCVDWVGAGGSTRGASTPTPGSTPPNPPFVPPPTIPFVPSVDSTAFSSPPSPTVFAPLPYAPLPPLPSAAAAAAAAALLIDPLRVRNPRVSSKRFCLVRLPAVMFFV